MGRTPIFSRLIHGVRSERGDTIVEVMISLLVIATILTGAFMVARNSTRNIQTSQEHAEAQQLLQGQVEMVRAQAGISGSNLNQDGVFCMNTTSKSAVFQNDTPDIFAASCTHLGAGGFYSVNVTKATASTDASVRQNARDAEDAGLGTTFVFAIDWDGLSGTTNRESFLYRILVTP